MPGRLKKFIKSLRTYRKVHRWIGLGLAIFVLLSSLTGLILAFKKDFSILQPISQRGTSQDLEGALPLDSLAALAENNFFQEKGFFNSIDRIDIRPSKGMSKIIFEKGYWEAQLDIHTGALLSLERRHSDWIEALHDGSIISEIFKKISMTYLSLGLFILVFSGIWLFFGPKIIRSKR